MDKQQDPERGKAIPVAPDNGDENAAFTQTPDRPYDHPDYWAPFILMGSWL